MNFAAAWWRQLFIEDSWRASRCLRMIIKTVFAWKDFVPSLVNDVRSGHFAVGTRTWFRVLLKGETWSREICMSESLGRAIRESLELALSSTCESFESVELDCSISRDTWVTEASSSLLTTGWSWLRQPMHLQATLHTVWRSKHMQYFLRQRERWHLHPKSQATLLKSLTGEIIKYGTAPSECDFP